MHEQSKFVGIYDVDLRMHRFNDAAKTGKTLVGHLGVHRVNSMTDTQAGLM